MRSARPDWWLVAGGWWLVAKRKKCKRRVQKTNPPRRSAHLFRVISFIVDQRWG
jgi:hypothetical protein